MADQTGFSFNEFAEAGRVGDGRRAAREGKDVMDVTLYSDGSSRGNPGPGGYGTILRYRAPSGAVHEKELSEGFSCTTNNRMELLGCIVGLEALRRPCTVTVYSDSQYLVNAFNQNWVAGWLKRPTAIGRSSTRRRPPRRANSQAPKGGRLLAGGPRCPQSLRPHKEDKIGCGCSVAHHPRIQGRAWPQCSVQAEISAQCGTFATPPLTSPLSGGALLPRPSVGTA